METRDDEDSDRALDLSPLVTPGPWDAVAEAYSTFIAETLGLYAEDALRVAALQEGERVIDVATGPGTLARLAARITEVDALDFSRDMLNALRRRASPGELLRLSLHRGDGQELPFPDRYFDVGFSMFGLFMFPDRARGLTELARVLKPNGRVVIGSWQAQDQVPALAIILDELKQLLPKASEGPAKAPMSDPDEIESEMEAAGFQVEIHGVSHQIESPSLDALWDGLRRSHVALVIAEKQLGAEPFRELLDAIRARLERELGSGPQSVVMPAWLSLGRLKG
ncbi:MAG: methyltransferase domain-containing protein [Myxococcota bacterium]